MKPERWKKSVHSLMDSQDAEREDDDDHGLGPGVHLDAPEEWDGQEGEE